MSESGDATVYADSEVTIEIVEGIGPFSNNAYIVRPVSGGAGATVIDVPGGFEQVIEALGGEPVERVVVTHGHRDHWDGFDVMRAAIAAPVFAGPRRRTSTPRAAPNAWPTARKSRSAGPRCA